MLRRRDNTIFDRTEIFLKEYFSHRMGNLFSVIQTVLKKKEKIEYLVAKHTTPFYIYDELALDDSIDRFIAVFSREIPAFKAYYALKINHYLPIVRRVLRKGMGLDVGSVREINMALKAGCEDMLFFSPGKTNSDVLAALEHADKLRIHIDSFSELRRLGAITNELRKTIRAGVRIHIGFHNDWKKYGIQIKDLSNFWRDAAQYPHIKLEGIHFHSSRNSDAIFYEKTIKILGIYLKKSFTKKELQEIRYVDFGGGFEVSDSEGYYPENTPQGTVIQVVNSHSRKRTDFKERYYIRRALTIEEYARKIGRSIKKYLVPLIDAEYFSEPGRIICNNAMHIVLSVADVKDKRNIVVDGGVNMVGWQRFEYEYFPLVNISNPSEKEIACNIWGNLCTTWDIWGYYCYAKEFQEHDIIIVPNQGALTYSLAQNFIQPIPNVYKL